MSAETYQFGGFQLDTNRHLLMRGEQAVALTPKTYDTLLMLVQSGGRLLSKDELLSSLWPDSFVEESNLTQQISTLRKVLGESPGEDRYIVTVPGRGYRFAAEVKDEAAGRSPSFPAGRTPALPDARGTPALPVETGEDVRSPLPSEARPHTSTSWVRTVIAVLAALALLGIAYWAFRRNSISTASASQPRSLAILPFRNLRQDPNSEFLGYSLADAVVTKLSYVSALTVRPSSATEKYRDQSVDIRRIASELNVDTLLMGNYIRDGDDIRITSELVDVHSQRILWKDAFDLKYERLLTVQDNVAQHIVKGLELKLTPTEAERLEADRPVDPLAYEYYLRGVDLYSRSDFSTAIKMLEKSAELNPTYALTWAQLGRAYNATASFQFGGRTKYQSAEAAYQRALALQPAQVETQVYMANMLTDTGRVEQAVPLLKSALQTNPNHAEAHWELGYAYRFAGALENSVEECEHARRLDPGVKLNSSALNSYLYLGRYDDFLKSLPRNDESALIVFYRGFGEYYKQDMDAAARDFDHAYELDPEVLQTQIGKALSYGIRHQEDKGLELLQTTENKINERGVRDPEAIYKIAQAYAVLGNKASALRVLRSSIENGFFSYPYFVKDPLLNGLRDEGEFSRLMDVAQHRHDAFRGMFR